MMTKTDHTEAQVDFGNPSFNVAGSESSWFTCYRHPSTETGLRCNRCGQPICIKCAKLTPVGYRCPECINAQRDRFYTGSKLDYLIAVTVALPLSLVVAASFTFLIGAFGFFSLFISLIGARLAGDFIADTVHRAVQKRRSRHLARFVVASLIITTLPVMLLALLRGFLFGSIAAGLLLIVGTGTILARLR